jgi:hypothetical protein
MCHPVHAYAGKANFREQSKKLPVSAVGNLPAHYIAANVLTNNLGGFHPIRYRIHGFPVITPYPLRLVTVIQMNRAAASAVSRFHVIQDIADHPGGLQVHVMISGCP